MAMNWPSGKKSGGDAPQRASSAGGAAMLLGDLLVQKGAITTDGLQRALAEQRVTGKKLGEILISSGALTEADLQRFLALQEDTPAIVPVEKIPQLPQSVMSFAVQAGMVVYVAHGRAGHPVIQSWLSECKRMGAAVVVESCDMDTLSRMRGAVGEGQSAQIANLSAVRMVRRVVADAVEQEASDISMTLVESGGSGHMDVHYRIKGDLQLVTQFTEIDGAQMIGAMFQGMSKVADATMRDSDDQNAVINDIAYLRGDDGKDLGLTGLRLAKSRLVSGTGVAVRLLYHQSGGGGLDHLDRLGYSPRQRAILERLARLTSGVNLFTGPTGSGKSTTLAAEIHMILARRTGIKIITIEDPVEHEFRDSRVWQYRIANANTDEEKSREFALKLKAALREDPDIIMVGELRGLETAQEAINAAMTGHQVWSTLHANDPSQVLQRLTGMGLEPFLLSDPKLMTSFIGQRLVKVLCAHCALPLDGHETELPEQSLTNLLTWTEGSPFRDLSNVRLKGPGCPHCRGSGVAGRTVAAQVIPTDGELLEDLLKLGPAQTRQKYLSRPDTEIEMQTHGILKVLAGETDLRFVEDMLDPISPRPAELRELSMEDL